MMGTSSERRFPWFFLLAGMVVAFAAFLGHPFCVSIDAPHHIRVAKDFFSAFMASPGYPDWDALAYGGRGSMAFRCLAPMPYAVAVCWQAIGVSVLAAIKLTVLVYALLGAWGVWRWMRVLGLDDAAGWGVFLWLAGPPVALHADFFFFYQNFCAMLLFPLVLAGWTETREKLARGPATLVLSFGGICWTHLQSAMMIVYVCAALALFEAIGKRSSTPYRRLLLMVVIALFLAAPHLLPFAASIGDTHLSRAMNGMQIGVDTQFVDDPVVPGNGEAGSRLSAVKKLVDICKYNIKSNTYSRPDGKTTDADPYRPNELLPWETLRPVLFLSFAVLACSAFAAGFAGTGGASVPFLMTGSILLLFTLRMSAPVWPWMPGWYSLQFPYRWLLPVHTLIVPAVAGLMGSGGRRSSRILGVTVILAALCGSLFLHSLTRSFDEDGFRIIREGYGVSWEFAPLSCSMPERLPGKSGLPHQTHIASVSGVIGNAEAGFEWSRFTASVRASEGANISICTHFDTDWRLVAGSVPVELKLDGPCGTMRAHLPAGIHQCRLVREVPPLRNIGWLLFGIGLVLACSGAWLKMS